MSKQASSNCYKLNEIEKVTNHVISFSDDESTHKRCQESDVTMNNEAIISNIELEEIKTDLSEKLKEDEDNGLSTFSDVFSAGDDEHSRNNTQRCRHLMKRCMKSRRLHVIVVILVILDSICVSVELIVDLIVTVYNQHRGDTANITVISSSPVITYQQPSQNQPLVTQRPKQDEYLWSFISDMNWSYLSVLVSIETFFKYFGLVILSLFVLEISCKIIFIPQELIKSKWGIFDAIVVFTSFVLDVILLKDKKILHTVSGLITLFRLWRITRIINGIVMTMEKKSTKKIEKLIKLIEKLKAENEQLKEIIREKNSLIESLNKTRKKSSVNVFG